MREVYDAADLPDIANHCLRRRRRVGLDESVRLENGRSGASLCRTGRGDADGGAGVRQIGSL